MRVAYIHIDAESWNLIRGELFVESWVLVATGSILLFKIEIAISYDETKDIMQWHKDTNLTPKW